jgi:predicted NBD/HSP70 family sugar kinase
MDSEICRKGNCSARWNSRQNTCTGEKQKREIVSVLPGPVLRDRPIAEPHNLGPGGMGFDFASAFGLPVRVINDAAMQALGSYEGGKMLFLGLGTGLGSAMIHL